MAEGDTILRAKQRLTDALVGQKIAVAAPNPRGRAAGVERLDGRTLERIDAHGKHLLFDFGDLVLHSHLGMSGGWHVYDRRARWRRPRSSAWAVLGGEHQDAVQFGGPALRGSARPPPALPPREPLRHRPSAPPPRPRHPPPRARPRPGGRQVPRR